MKHIYQNSRNKNVISVTMNDRREEKLSRKVVFLFPIVFRSFKFTNNGKTKVYNFTVNYHRIFIGEQINTLKTILGLSRII